jgi:hypothetical protein
MRCQLQPIEKRVLLEDEREQDLPLEIGSGMTEPDHLLDELAQLSR